MQSEKKDYIIASIFFGMFFLLISIAALSTEARRVERIPKYRTMCTQLYQIAKTSSDSLVVSMARPRVKGYEEYTCIELQRKDS